MERRGKSCKFSRNTHLNGEFRLKNREIAEIFETIADLLEIKGEAVYRVIAYRRAGEALRSLGRDVNIVWEEGDLEVIPGVGTVQRAWAEAPSIVNTWPLNRLQVWLKSRG